MKPSIVTEYYLSTWSTSNWSQRFRPLSMSLSGSLIHWTAVITWSARSWILAFQSSEVSLGLWWLEMAADDMLWTPREEKKTFQKDNNKLFTSKLLQFVINDMANKQHFSTTSKHSHKYCTHTCALVLNWGHAGVVAYWNDLFFFRINLGLRPWEGESLLLLHYWHRPSMTQCG